MTNADAREVEFDVADEFAVLGDDSDGPVGDIDCPRTPVQGNASGAVGTGNQEVGRPRIRVAMMFFWICDVPPMTLCARL
jgi:hypothetical protein